MNLRNKTTQWVIEYLRNISEKFENLIREHPVYRDFWRRWLLKWLETVAKLTKSPQQNVYRKKYRMKLCRSSRVVGETESRIVGENTENTIAVNNDASKS